MTASRKNPAEERGAGAGTGTGATSNPTIRVMLCSVCIAMLLTGDAGGAGAVASLLLDRPDIRAVCSVLSHSDPNYHSSTTQSAPVHPSPSSGGVTNGDQVEDVSEVERRRDAVAAAVNSALSFFGGHSA
jgi:hypothetical protein